MLTLEEAIKHCEEKAKELNCQIEKGEIRTSDILDCFECANEHLQLAEWLKELKDFRLRFGENQCSKCKFRYEVAYAYPCAECAYSHDVLFEEKESEE